VNVDVVNLGTSVSMLLTAPELTTHCLCCFVCDDCSGHDCGVYMLMIMDLLSIRADGLYFGQPYVRNARDKLLLSLLQGRVAHFPEAFLEGT